ncbi:hypothetical protein [Metabacillus indicus]|uniref:hypothetical protein n=1 Tax=Metabacillus indicus TaxID=246786 RepID=UPI003CFBA5CD
MTMSIMKFEERDSNLPKWREELIAEIEQDLLLDDSVSAVFYGGSIGAGNTDLYSDIDLRIVVKDDEFEQYRQNKQNRAERWGNVLFFEDFPWTVYSIAHFDCFIKVDSFYYRSGDLSPSVWLRDIKIVKDHECFLENLRSQSKPLKYKASEAEFDIWRNKFFAYAHEAYRRCMRGEFLYALSCLDMMRWSIAAGWFMEKGYPPNNPGDWAKIEGARSKLTETQQSLLKTWDSGREKKQILCVLHEMTPEFIAVHKRLCAHMKIDEKSESVSRILAMIQ